MCITLHTLYVKTARVDPCVRSADRNSFLPDYGRALRIVNIEPKGKHASCAIHEGISKRIRLNFNLS